MKWKDNTTCPFYSKGNKEQESDKWELHKGQLRIIVTSGHTLYRPEWVMRCDALGINTLELSKGLTKEQAQTEAFAIVENKLKSLMADLCLILLER